MSEQDFLATGGKITLYHCSVCKRDITSTLRIRCAECHPSVDLCADCFCVGATVVNSDCTHLASHSYRVVDCLDPPIFGEADWSAAEELLLLEGSI